MPITPEQGKEEEKQNTDDVRNDNKEAEKKTAKQANKSKKQSTNVCKKYNEVNQL